MTRDGQLWRITRVWLNCIERRGLARLRCAGVPR
jgi:hypothetical protein